MTTARPELGAIEASLPDPARGLPEDVFEFVSRLTPLVNVDLLIKDPAGRTLLTWRDDDRYGTGWHVPGSIIRYKETAAARIHACAHDELGAEIEAEPSPIVVLESIDPWKTRGHVISLLFRCRLQSAPDERRRAGGAPKAGEWRWHERCPPDLLPAHQRYASVI
jgi:colanic acid biosynthesis protein WcaH